MEILNRLYQNATSLFVPFPVPRPHSPQTRQLFGQLVRLLHGDSAAANRLVDSQRLKTPNKSEEWILEKVVSDLRRDRSC